MFMDQQGGLNGIIVPNSYMANVISKKKLLQRVESVSVRFW